MSVVTDRLRLTTVHLRLGLFAVFGIGFLAMAVPGFLEPMTFWIGIVIGDYAYPTHELHHFLLGTYFGVLFLGVLAQAVYPSRHVGALHTSLILFTAAIIGLIVTGAFDVGLLILLGLLVGMVLAHPSGMDQLPSRDTFDPTLGVMAGVTAIGAVVFASIEWYAQITVNDPHVAFGHYIFTGAIGLSIAVLTLYGSFRGMHWRFPIYTAGLFLFVLGVSSIRYPGAEQGSSLGVIGGVVVTLWAIVLIVIAERGDALRHRLGI